MIELQKQIQKELEEIDGDNLFEVVKENNCLKISVNNKFLVEIQDELLTLEQFEILKSKVRYSLGQANRIHGRKCKLKKITKPEAENFFKENHWLGATSSKVNIGAFYNDELVAACSFAAPKKFREGYYSGELIRFANKNYTIVVGGLDKLIKWYVKNYPVNDVMTYVDKKWGSGEAFEQLGFNKKQSKTPFSYKYVFSTDNLSDN